MYFFKIFNVWLKPSSSKTSQYLIDKFLQKIYSYLNDSNFFDEDPIILFTYLIIRVLRNDEKVDGGVHIMLKCNTWYPHKRLLKIFSQLFWRVDMDSQISKLNARTWSGDRIIWPYHFIILLSHLIFFVILLSNLILLNCT